MYNMYTHTHIKTTTRVRYDKLNVKKKCTLIYIYVYMYNINNKINERKYTHRTVFNCLLKFHCVAYAHDALN